MEKTQRYRLDEFSRKLHGFLKETLSKPIAP